MPALTKIDSIAESDNQTQFQNVICLVPLVKSICRELNKMENTWRMLTSVVSLPTEQAH